VRRTGGSKAQPLEILFFTLEYEPGVAGGAERQARLQAEGLARRGHRVSVVCPRSTGQRTGPVGGVQVSRLPRSRRRRLRKVSYAVALGCWLIVRGRRFDIWHIHLASRQADWAVLLGGLLRRPTYVKVASGGETGEIRLGQRSAWMTRRIGLLRAGRVQALTDEIAAELQAVGVRPDRIVRIPNGLDLSIFRPADASSRRAMRRKLGLPFGPPVILYTGRFAEYKGVGDLLRAWPDVALRAGGVLVLVGARGWEDRPLALPVDGPRVVSRRWTSDIVEYLQSADVFVYPSHQDGMSNALLEAMACGLPSVATSIPAVEGLLEHERNALLIPPFAPAELSAALLRVLHDEQLRADIGHAAAQTAREYSLEGVVSSIERTYAQLTGTC
jgi:glycosyltransferase involved in cell wall biosynthesis